MSQSNNSSSIGIGLTGATFILFLGLKLANIIEWSWWWVFAPLWIPVTLVIVVSFLLLIFAIVRDFIKD